MPDQTPDPQSALDVLTIAAVPSLDTVAMLRLSGPLGRETEPEARTAFLSAITSRHSKPVLDVLSVGCMGVTPPVYGMHRAGRRAGERGGEPGNAGATERVGNRLAIIGANIPTADTVTDDRSTVVGTASTEE